MEVKRDGTHWRFRGASGDWSRPYGTEAEAEGWARGLGPVERFRMVQDAFVDAALALSRAMEALPGDFALGSGYPFEKPFGDTLSGIIAWRRATALATCVAPHCPHAHTFQSTVEPVGTACADCGRIIDPAGPVPEPNTIGALHYERVIDGSKPELVRVVRPHVTDLPCAYGQHCAAHGAGPFHCCRCGMAFNHVGLEGLC